MPNTTTTARGLGVPIWVRVPGIIVLVAVVVSAMLMGAAGVGDGGGAERHTPDQNWEQQTGPGDTEGHQPPAGGHE